MTAAVGRLAAWIAVLSVEVRFGSVLGPAAVAVSSDPFRPAVDAGALAARLAWLVLLALTAVTVLWSWLDLVVLIRRRHTPMRRRQCRAGRGMPVDRHPPVRTSPMRRMALAWIGATVAVGGAGPASADTVGDRPPPAGPGPVMRADVAGTTASDPAPERPAPTSTPESPTRPPAASATVTSRDERPSPRAAQTSGAATPPESDLLTPPTQIVLPPDGTTPTRQTVGPPGTEPSGTGLGTVGPAPASPTAPAGTTTVDRWTVGTGDSFWSIAEAFLTVERRRSGAPAPAEADVAAYWLRLIDANRHELVHPDDPDLVFRGQVFHLPRP